MLFDIELTYFNTFAGDFRKKISLTEFYLWFILTIDIYLYMNVERILT